MNTDSDPRPSAFIYGLILSVEADFVVALYAGLSKGYVKC